MQAAQIELVRRTWLEVVPDADRAAARFYGRLFELDPSTAALFHGDLGRQGLRLMAMINFIVRRLHALDEVLWQLRELGRRHARYGVCDRHYDAVGAALLWTIERGMDGEFTPAVRDAWLAVYAELAAVMREGASADIAREVAGAG